MSRFIRGLIVLAFAFFFTPPAFALEQPALRRFALIASSNDGGLGRAKLRYAQTDAMAVAKVFGDLGGVSRDDTLVLLDSTRSSFQSGIADITERIRVAKLSKGRIELFVYYSGHSNEEGLLLGEEKFSYGELRKALEHLSADVRIAILDSCASGAMTRSKGGVMRAPFLLDASSKVQGHAFLTSSSADEVAQESDLISASFFTHFLVSGLRGAADYNHDQRVTLNEAYQFAFSETLARTEKTRGGAQHAAYDIQLSGAGDLVLTDLRQTSAGLVLGELLQGRVYIRDFAGSLVVELNKFPGKTVELGLEAGRYQVVVERDRKLYEAGVILREGRHTELTAEQLTLLKIEHTTFRGDYPLEYANSSSASTEPAKPSKVYAKVPATFAILPSLTKEGFYGANQINNFSFNLLAGHNAVLEGVEVSPGFNSRSDRVRGAQLAYVGNFAGLGFWSNPDAVGDIEGAQVAFGFNIARGHVTGSQIAYGYNGTGGDFHGLQIAFGANSARSNNGLQLAFGANLAGVGIDEDNGPWGIGDSDFQGAVGFNFARRQVRFGQIAFGANYAGDEARYLQLAFGANFADGDVAGLQTAFGANFTRANIDGMQLAFGANINGGAVRGMQNSFGGNYASTVTGAQISYGGNVARELNGFQNAVVNVVAGDVRGAQIGLVNVGGAVKGAQIGLINYSEEMTGAAIGIISVTRKNPVRAVVWASDVNALNIGLKFGSKYVYNLLTVGAHPGANKHWSFGWGLGGHFAYRKAYLEVDGTVNMVHWDKNALLFGGPNHSRNGLIIFRTLAGYQFSKRFSVFAGPTYNGYVSFKNDAHRGRVPTFFPTKSETKIDTKNNNNVRTDTWQGFLVGVQF